MGSVGTCSRQNEQLRLRRRLRRSKDPGLADSCVVTQYLADQLAAFYYVVVHKAKAACTGCCQVLSNGAVGPTAARD